MSAAETTHRNQQTKTLDSQNKKQTVENWFLNWDIRV